MTSQIIIIVHFLFQYFDRDKHRYNYPNWVRDDKIHQV